MVSFRLRFIFNGRNYTMTTQEAANIVKYMDPKSTYGSLLSPSIADLCSYNQSQFVEVDTNHYGGFSMAGVARNDMNNFIDTDAAPSTSNGSNMWNPACYWGFFRPSVTGSAYTTNYTMVLDAKIVLSGNKK